MVWKMVTSTLEFLLLVIYLTYSNYLCTQAETVERKKKGVIPWVL